MSRKIVLLAIRSLDVGGAERQFLELVKGIDKDHFDVTVCTMYGGEMEEELEAVDGIDYIDLKKGGRYDLVGFALRYGRVLRRKRPRLIYSFLGEMNLFSLWCKPADTRLVWGFRASDMDLSRYDRVSRLLFGLQKRLCKKVDKIICNSNACIDYHKSRGFAMERAVTIPNGIDTERFRPDLTLREKFRKEWGLQETDLAVGIVARLDPMKGYELFAGVAAKLMERYENLYFFAAGEGDEGIRKSCEELLGRESGRRFIWQGGVKDVERLYNGLDIVVSSSIFGEGFSNTIAEAMACATPCVVTDVGDSAMIVGESGLVVPPADAQALERAIEEMMKAERKMAGEKARARIVSNFSLQSMIEATQKELTSCAALWD